MRAESMFPVQVPPRGVEREEQLGEETVLGQHESGGREVPAAARLWGHRRREGRPRDRAVMVIESWRAAIRAASLQSDRLLWNVQLMLWPKPLGLSPSHWDT